MNNNNKYSERHYQQSLHRHALHQHPTNNLSLRVAVAALAAGVFLGMLFIAIVVVLDPLP